MANIVLITQFFLPESGAGAKRVFSLAESLKKENNLKIYTCLPSYPSPDLYNGLDLKKYDANLGLNITRLFRFSPKRNNFIIRGLQETKMALSFMISILKNRGKCDVLIASSPSMFLIPISYIVSRLKKNRLVLDIRDLTWQYAREVVDISRFKRLILSAIQRLMLYCIKKADLVVGATHGLTSKLISGGVNAGKIITIVNGVDEQFFQGFDEKNGKLSGNPKVSYIGLFGFNHGITTVVEVAKLLPGVEFVLYGDGPDKPELERLIDSQGILNIKMPGYLTTQHDLINAYRNADILFSHIKDIPILNDIAVPAKIYEYMATGKPIIYAGKGLAVDFLNQDGCALITEPDNPQKIAEAISHVLDNYEDYLEMGRKGRKRIELKYLRSILFGRLGDEIGNLCKKPV